MNSIPTTLITMNVLRGATTLLFVALGLLVGLRWLGDGLRGLLRLEALLEGELLGVIGRLHCLLLGVASTAQKLAPFAVGRHATMVFELEVLDHLDHLCLGQRVRILLC